MAADAVLLIAFGGPTRPEEVRPFLANVVRGRKVPPERIEEVVRHYDAIGGRSPLNDLTLRQACKLEAALVFVCDGGVVVCRQWRRSGRSSSGQGN